MLYASQGQYDKARSALELSIRTHPSYATAYENLGDLYAKMASQAYDRALQLDKSNTAVQAKLEMIKELFSSGARATGKPAATKSTSTIVAGANPVPVEVHSVVIAAPTPSTATAASIPSVTAPVAVKASEPVKSATAAPAESDVLKTVNHWAKAWSDNDVAGYLACYAPDFQTPGGASRKKSMCASSRPR